MARALCFLIYLFTFQDTRDFARHRTSYADSHHLARQSPPCTPQAVRRSVASVATEGPWSRAHAAVKPSADSATRTAPSPRARPPSPSRAATSPFDHRPAPSLVPLVLGALPPQLLAAQVPPWAVHPARPDPRRGAHGHYDQQQHPCRYLQSREHVCSYKNIIHVLS